MKKEKTSKKRLKEIKKEVLEKYYCWFMANDVWLYCFTFYQRIIN